MMKKENNFIGTIPSTPTVVDGDEVLMKMMTYAALGATGNDNKGTEENEDIKLENVMFSSEKMLILRNRYDTKRIALFKPRDLETVLNLELNDTTSIAVNSDIAISVTKEEDGYFFEVVERKTPPLEVFNNKFSNTDKKLLTVKNAGNEVTMGVDECIINRVEALSACAGVDDIKVGISNCIDYYGNRHSIVLRYDGKTFSFRTALELKLERKVF